MYDDNYKDMKRHVASYSTALDFYNDKNPEGYFEKLFLPIATKTATSTKKEPNDVNDCLGFAIEYNCEITKKGNKIVRLIFGSHQLNPKRRLNDNISATLKNYFKSIGHAYRADAKKGYAYYCANHDKTTTPDECSILNSEYWHTTMIHTIKSTSLKAIKEELIPYIGDIAGALKAIDKCIVLDLPAKSSTEKA